MKKCSKILVSIITIVILSNFTGFCVAEEKATKEECITKVEQAAKLIQEIGLKPALEKIMDKNGPYKWKDSYVFLMDIDTGKMTAHPKPGFVGFHIKSWKDADGRQPYSKIIDEIETKEKGWVHYNYQPRGSQYTQLKNSYFFKVPGERVIVNAGYYN